MQVHKAGQTASILGRNGGDFTRRLPSVAASVLPVRSCIIDGELITGGAHGEPDFLISSRCCTALQGRDLRDQPLVERRAKLKALLARSKGDLIRAFGLC